MVLCIDYLTDHLGYTRFKANQSAGTKDSTTNIVDTSDDDSDSECDEYTIIVLSFPSNHFSGTEHKDSTGVTKGDLSYAEELAKLQRQEHDAKEAAEELLRQETIEVNRNKDAAGGDSVSADSGSVAAGSVTISTGCNPASVNSAEVTNSSVDNSVPAAPSSTPSVENWDLMNLP